MGAALAIFFGTSCRQTTEADQAAGTASPVSNNAATHMKATIQNKLFYDTIPSASGLEAAGDFYYVIGDDSPFLYKLDSRFQLIDRLALTDTVGFSTGRVAKADKLDLEGMASFERQGRQYLLLLGSGSSERRNSAFLVELPEPPGSELRLTLHQLDAVYARIQQDNVLVGEGQLNIEGVAVGNGRLFLLQRGVGLGSNVLLSYELEAFYNYLLASPAARSADSRPAPAAGNLTGTATASGEAVAVPVPRQYRFSLPVLGELQAGFSGAFVYDDKLFFTASIEDTQDAINDGDVLGSYIGYMPLNALSEAAEDALPAPATLITFPDNGTYTGKVESLVVLGGSEGAGGYRVVAVSDDDKGNSELLEIVLDTR